ncbi:MAG: hypothetical protein Q9169_006273 [Polycauliona sp. 2 TL-2023]
MTFFPSTLENNVTSHRKNVLAWLDAPNPTSKYTNAVKTRHIGTGTWYTNSNAFDRWANDSKSISWLWGIPGCGKTVLSATIIEKFTDLCSHDQNRALAYLYFAFDNQALQNVEGMIRSLIHQLCSQRTSLPDCVDTLYMRCLERRSQATPPTYDMLKNMLHQVFGCFNDTYIVLDALDECTERHELITVLEEIAHSQKPGLHLLTTSRQDWDIQDCMNSKPQKLIELVLEELPWQTT